MSGSSGGPIAVCAKCGIGMTSWTTVNGNAVCDWCKPKAPKTDDTREPVVRGWWIRIGDKHVSGSQTAPDMVHVIEHSAYAAIKQERDELALKYECACQDLAKHLEIGNEFISERNLLRAEAEGLRRELKHFMDKDQARHELWNNKVGELASKLTQERSKAARLVEALREIRDEDYRGNRPRSAEIAFKVLADYEQKYKKENK